MKTRLIARQLGRQVNQRMQPVMSVNYSQPSVNWTKSSWLNVVMELGEEDKFQDKLLVSFAFLRQSNGRWRHRPLAQFHRIQLLIPSLPSNKFQLNRNYHSIKRSIDQTESLNQQFYSVVINMTTTCHRHRLWK